MITPIIISSVVLISILVFILTSKKKYEGLTITIAFIALIISFIGTFRSLISPFKLEVLAKNFVFCHIATDLPKNSIPIVIPISFINRGHGEGIVHDIALVIIDENGKSSLHRPKFEINISACFKGDQELKGGDLENIFSPFVIGEKGAIVKSIVFVEEPNVDSLAVRDWQPGFYTFQIHALSHKKKNPDLLREFKIQMTQSFLDHYHSGSSSGGLIWHIKIKRK